eukprot:16384050-Heterocapsa_arctica.AAC.1
MSCHCPFVFDALMGVETRRIKVPAVAAKVVRPGALSASGSSQPPKEFTPTQIAKAIQGSQTTRT